MTKWFGRQSTRELARDGQVYYVYNRVNDIADVAGRIQSLVPDANVAFAHGQMKERELEDIMYDFINGDIDVLVSTTIIETGSGYSECEYDDHTGCGQIRIISALSASGTCRSFQPNRLRLPNVSKELRFKRRSRKTLKSHS